MRGNERAVAPVVSTILVVAIAIILAATVAVFVLDLGERTSDPAPTTSFEFEETDDGTVLATHISGDTIASAALDVQDDTGTNGVVLVPSDVDAPGNQNLLLTITAHGVSLDPVLSNQVKSSSLALQQRSERALLTTRTT